MTYQPLTQLRDAALTAADRGWHVFPLRPDDKRPALNGWEEQATTDLARVHAYWTRVPYNIGIACGPSSLLVVDLDMPKEPLQPNGGRPAEDGRTTLARLASDAGHVYPDHTYAVTTRTGGTHLYFRQTGAEPLRNTAGRLGPLIDTRGQGGYVVAAGSTVGGRSYVPGDVQTVAGIPTWLTVALQPPSAGTVCETALLIDDIRHGSKYAAAALTTASERVRSAQPGTRNHVLNAAAYSLGRLVGTGLLTTADTTTVLFDAARTSGLADAEITRTIRSGLTAGTQNPKPLHQ